MRLEGGGLGAAIAAPVKAGSELLGSIWVAEGDVELGAAAEQELARIAERAAVDLISHRISDHLKCRLRGAFVREVLEEPASGRGPTSTSWPRASFTVLASSRRSPATAW